MRKLISLILLFSISLPILLNNKTVSSDFENINLENDSNLTTNIRYRNKLIEWESLGVRDDIEFREVISPLNFMHTEGELLSNVFGKNYAYDFSSSSSFDVLLDVPKTGLYNLGIDYLSVSKSIRDIGLEVLVDDKLQYHESGQIILKNMWETTNKFETDRYNNDIMPNASVKEMWVLEYFRDTQRLEEKPLLFFLEEGMRKITFKRKQGEFLVGSVYIENNNKLISYDNYFSKYKNNTTSKSFLELEAENPSFRNDLSIKYQTDRDTKVTPFALMENRLNIVDASSFSKAGSSITYQVNVKDSGMYNVTLKSKQPKANSNVYRTLYVNGLVPFEEAKEIVFSPSTKWKNYTLGNENGAFYFYLTEGINYLTLEVNSSPFKNIYYLIEDVMNELNDLSLDIKKITGNKPSKDIDFDLEDNIPNLVNKLESFKNRLKEAYNLNVLLNGNNKNTEININLKRSIELLEYFIKSPNKIPKEINKFSVGNSSILQKLGVILPLTINQPLSIDKLYIHSDDIKLPKAKANFFASFWVGVKRFFLSFFSDTYNEKVLDDEIKVWVNRSRQYVDLMQQLADKDFTKETGIKVKVQIMPNEDKLILATSSNTEPDVALGVAGWRPYDFAIRNAIVNLREFDDFYEVAARFMPGAFAQLIYQDGIYGLPETQNFSLLFYRTDIMNNINVEIPNTWDDVLDILPEINRYGLNFYSPLSNPNAFKAYINTMPFINQFGGVLYNNDLLSSNLTNENTINALNFMAELYTIYSLPLEVGSFYNQFRYGTIPIGIGDFGMYVQLLHAAPEIQGLWDVAVMPGILQSDGFIDRSYDGAATSGMIFKKSKHVLESWEFLKWWTKYETQLDYSENLVTSMGPEYMWNTSNVNAFRDYSWDTNHKNVILEQWNHIFDTPKTPASYMVEREISNIWNKVVYDGVVTRTAISDSEIIINKEITKKMIEFGYIDKKGKVLKPYLFPTRETINQWVKR